MALELIPSILLQEETSVRTRIESLQNLVEWIQLDVLDNTLYSNTSWADAGVIREWNLSCKLELDLMVADPEKVIENWKDVAAFQRAIWHIEADIDHKFLIDHVRSLGREVGLSIAPGTSLQKLEPYLSQIDRVLILGVKPGWSGQAMIPETLKTVQALTECQPHPVIAFDGGINEETFAQIVIAGAQALCPNSWIFQYPPVQQRLEEIRAKLEKLKK